MNSGTTFEEIKRLFDYLEENKTNNDLQIILTTEGCHDLYKLFIDCNQYQKILEERIYKAIEYIYLYSTQRKYFKNIIDRLNNQEIQFKGKIEDLLKILKGEENENNESN